MRRSGDISAKTAPNLEDVARLAGVSRATASRVANGSMGVSAVLAERVREAIAMVGYVPNRTARALMTGRTGSVALIFSSARDAQAADDDSGILTDPLFGRVAAGVQQFLSGYGAYPTLMVARSPEDKERTAAYLRAGNADGALVISRHGMDSLPEMLSKTPLPMALFAKPTSPMAASFVDVDHFDGARLAVDCLVAQGRKQVVTVSGPLVEPVGRDRFEGFRHAMTRHGRPQAPSAEGHFTRAGGEAAMRHLLARHPDLDGVFAANDRMAHGVLHALRLHGRKVPEDVGVVGFDDDETAATSSPALTTVCQPVEEMAAEMARLLMLRLASPGSSPRSTIFEPVLVQRGST